MLRSGKLIVATSVLKSAVVDGAPVWGLRKGLLLGFIAVNVYAIARIELYIFLLFLLLLGLPYVRIYMVVWLVQN